MELHTVEIDFDRWVPRQRAFTAMNLLGATTVAAAAGAGSPLFVYEQGRWHFPDSTKRGTNR
ncbi:hypothetical protein [Branchiibius sp. NY16-3462-2]|uniref:hypothetical protein n=1 Tax=Branchiibius sp. NY16-3462-2 TaxID=1807500 RepID=UPI000795F9A8|nr:hypothetical protein [Branchiibius sp. NY16-3462-2]KYH43665.1 hypothetical protein AZH51_02315 [Branchiibius sp. NY16-3462-2]